jgi:RluA family pseudouridine synthase
MKRKTSTTIQAVAAGMSVLNYLTKRFSYHGREEWQAAIAARKILLNNIPAEETSALTSGDQLEYLCDFEPEPPVTKDFSLLFEDEYLLAVDKPGNLPCHPGGRFFNHTLWALLRNRPGLDSLVFVNRLDRETSGVVLLAKSADTARRCQALFQRSKVDKRYIVLVEGTFPATLDGHGLIFSDPSSLIRKKQRFSPMETVTAFPANAREVTTIFRRLRCSQQISQVEAAPITGRHHQIRATLHSLGYPVVGDKLYGLDEQIFLRYCKGQLSQADRDTLRMARQALHAASLVFIHPHTGREIQLTAPLPADMQAVAKKHPPQKDQRQ